MRLEPVLASAATLIEAGNLADAREHVLNVAHGLLSSEAADEDLPAALKAMKAVKERAQLDWGRLSATIINDPTNSSVIKQLTTLEAHVTNLRQHLVDAKTIVETPDVSPRELDPERRNFSTGLDSRW